jgi:hypothetical protein
MAKIVPKFRKNRDYEYGDDESVQHDKRDRKKNQRKMKYFDEFESYDSRTRQSVRPQKIR